MAIRTLSDTATDAIHFFVNFDAFKPLAGMGRQMYFYYLEWLFVYNQNKYGYM